MDIPAIIRGSVPKSYFKKKGDLATVNDDGQLNTLSVGPDGTILAADSAEPTGFKWVSGSGSVASWGGITGSLNDQGDLVTALSSKEPANANLQAHVNAVGNPHGTTSAEIGLGNVTNDAQIPKSLVTAKGDLLVATGSGTVARQAVGSDGQILQADSSQPAGVKWAPAGSGSATWGGILGALADQADLQTALAARAPKADKYSDDYADLASAIGALNTAGAKVILHVTSNQTVSGNITANGNITLRVHRGAIISINNGSTLTLSGSLEAGPYQIFSLAGTGKVAFDYLAGKSVGARRASLRWWGAKGDGVTNDTVPIQAAINAFDGFGANGRGIPGVLHGEPGDKYLVDALSWTTGFPADVGGSQYFLANGAQFIQAGTNFQTVQSFLPAAVDAVNDTITLSTPLANGTPVRFSNNGGALPGIARSEDTAHASDPTLWNAVFYVCEAVGNTIKLAGKPNMTHDLDLLDQGTGTHKITVATSDILQITQQGGSLMVEGWVAKGVQGRWVTSVVPSQPTRMRFGATIVDTPVANIRSLIAVNQWYWDSNSGLLFVYCNCGIEETPDSCYNKAEYDIGAGFVEIPDSDWTRWSEGTAFYVGHYGGANVNLKNCRVWYIDKCIEVKYSIGSIFEDIGGNGCNCVVYGDSNRGNNNTNYFRNIRCSAVYGYDAAIYWANARNNTFNYIIGDITVSRLLHLLNCKGTSLKNLSTEMAGQLYQYPDPLRQVTEQVLLDACHGIDFEACDFWVAGGYVTRCFRFINGTRGVKISGSTFDIHQADLTRYLYSSDGSTTGIVFVGCGTYDGKKLIICEDAIPTANLVSFAYPANSALHLPPAMAKRVSDPDSLEYASVPMGDVFRGTTASSYPSIVYAVDRTTGYRKNCSWKINWGAAGSITFSGFFGAGPSGTWYPVLSFFYKSDTDQKIDYRASNGPYAQGLNVRGDGLWRYTSVVGDSTSVASSILDLLLWSNATSGNLWIDEVSLRYFPSRQAACEWMGCVAEPNKLDFTLPTGTTVPSVKAARGRNATFWVNNPSTQSIGTLYDGVPGQEITLGILENNTKFYKLLHMTNVFPCRNDGTFDSNRNGQVAWNYFQTPTAGDCIYAGHQGAPFAGLTLQVGTAVTGTGLSFTWQYWNGSAWADLGIATPDQFTATGAKTVYWYPPADWQRNRINNVTAYWIKITVNGSITNTGANATAPMNGSNLRLKADFGRPGGDHQTCWLKLKNYNGCWFELGNSTE